MNQTVDLAYQKWGDKGPSLIILHGLFGMGRNWVRIAKALSQNYQVYLLDLRNHGDSPWHNEWDFDVMSQDVMQFRLTHDIKNPILLGHSLGGKVAMMFAGRYYPSPLKALVVLDISPRAYDSKEHTHIVNALMALDLENLESRSQALEQLKPAIPSERIRQFLLTNLRRNPEGYYWKLNLPVIARQLKQVMGAVKDDFNDDFVFHEAPSLFLKGELSAYIQASDEKLIRKNFPLAQIRTIPNAGHWAHAEAPEAFLSLLKGFLAGL